MIGRWAGSVKSNDVERAAAPPDDLDSRIVRLVFVIKYCIMLHTLIRFIPTGP